MKIIPTFATILALACSPGVARGEPLTAGPKGGRLLENDPPRAEFFVEKDRTVTITFYEADGKPVAAGTQTVTAIAETKAGKTRMEFEKKGDALVSKTALPEGNGYTVVVQLRATPEARPQNFRIVLDLSNCGGCQHAEYACTCGH